MKLTLKCPKAVYDRNMRIICKKDLGPCGHQRFKPCKGWSVLTDWQGCPYLKEETDGKD